MTRRRGKSTKAPQRSERSARLIERLSLEFEELAVSATEDEPAAEKAVAKTANVRPFTRRPSERNTFPEHLPRERVVLDPPTACECCGGYLPPYSPDFNPIENAFAKLKALLRKAAERTVDGLWNAIGAILQTFPPTECALLRRRRIRCNVSGFRLFL
jgi:hypothetical protein